MSIDAVVLAFEHLAGLSYGSPATQAEFVHRLAPYDTPADADNLAGGQSCCATATCAGLLIAEVDGTVTDFRGKGPSDPLRSPRKGHYDSPAYLETLARQRGLLRRPVAGQRPDISAGCILSLGAGNDVHLIMVVGDVDAEGFMSTVEGGQVDPLSKHTGAASCTAINRKRRTARRVGSLWCCFDDKGRDGRALNWWCQAGDLPTVQG